MTTDQTTAIIVRQLTSSDLGWFAELRDRGLVTSKQRAINFNATIVAAILPPQILSRGEIMVRARCLRPEAPQEEERPLGKVGKNWRLGGRKVPGELFLNVKPGDLFICKLTINNTPPFDLPWTIVTQALEPEKHAALLLPLAPHLSNKMALFSGNDSLLALLDVLLAPSPQLAQAEQHRQPPATTPSPPKVNPIPSRTPRRLTVKERLRQPHIMGEMIKLSLSQSSEAQKQYLDVLETLAGAIRAMLDAAGLIQSIETNHGRLWAEVAGRPIAFVDGGMANVTSLGAEPVAS